MPPTSDAREPSSAVRWAVLIGSALLIAVRAPILILEPRLWAEESSVYLAHALSHGLLSSLLLVPTSSGPAGYLNLPANLAATLPAHFFSLESAAAVATAVAFLIQLLPFALVLWGRSRFWTTPARRFAVCAFLLFAPAVRPDVWLSTINSQVFCGLAAFLLLTEDLRSASRRRTCIYRVLLVFCGLSGAYTVLLFLPFVVRAYLERSEESKIQAFLVGLCGAIQVACYLMTLAVAPHSGFRLDEPRWAAKPTVILLEHLVAPIIGTPLTERAMPRGPLADDLYGALPAEAWQSVGVGLLSLALAIAFWVWLSRRRADPFYWLFPLSFAALSGGTALLAAGLPRRRYAVLAGLVWLLALLVASWSEAPASRRRQVCRLLLGLSLLAGVSTYRLEVPWYRQGQAVGHFGSDPGRPDWRAEISRWRQDPSYRVKAWPYVPGLSWSTPLTQRSDLRSLQAAFDRSLPIQTQNGTESRIQLGTLPAEFRLRLHGRIDDASETSDLSVALGDCDHPSPTGTPLTDLERSFTRELASSRFATDFEGPDSEDQDFADPDSQDEACFWLRPGSESSADLSLGRINVLPAQDGLLDLLVAKFLGAGGSDDGS